MKKKTLFNMSVCLPYNETKFPEERGENEVAPLSI